MKVSTKWVPVNHMSHNRNSLKGAIRDDIGDYYEATEVATGILGSILGAPCFGCPYV